MKKEEFLYDYSLEFLTYLVDKYVEENIKVENNNTYNEKVYHIADVL